MTQQDRKWELKLYPDATNYDCNAVLIKAQQYFDFWAYILHDQDKGEDGSPIKPHYHFYGKCTNKLTLKGIAYQLGLPDSAQTAIQYVQTWKGAMRYLTHIDYPEKHPYPLENVFSNFDLSPFYRSQHDDDEMAKKIFEYIRDHKGCTQESLMEWVFANSLWSAYRRGFAVFSKLMRGDFDNESRRYPPYRDQQ